MTSTRNWRRSALAAATALAALGGAASAAPVDLSTWSYTAGGTWNVAPDNNSVLQGTNGNPTIFYSGTNDKNKSLSGTIKVETTSDDDFIGFVLGFNSGDATNPAADYILIDWKQTTQGWFGCSGQAGLAISRVTGAIGNNSGAWCHDPANNVTELARATTLGSTGWADNQEYTFDLTFRDDLIEVYVDGILELSVAGIFADGSFGFYNYSQAIVRYAGIEEEDIPPQVPLPAALPLMLCGMGGLAFASRGRRRAA